MSRRKFVGAAAALTGTTLLGCSEPQSPVNSLESATLKARPGVPDETATKGFTSLGLGNTRDGFLYVPPSYTPGVAAPLLVLLHGATGSAAAWEGITPSLADEKGVVVMAPDSYSRTWDRILGMYGHDVSFIDAALTLTFRKCNIKPQSIAIAGFSDGATYALSLGISNGDLFPHIIAWSPGFTAHAGKRGTPRVFVSHGTNDTVLPIDICSRKIVPALRKQGLSVTYQEFEGGHAMPPAIREQAMDWFLPTAV